MQNLALDYRNQGDRFPFRSNSRFTHTDEGWFLSTREGLMGPYSSREDAEIEAMIMLRRMLTVDRFGVESEHRVSQ